MVEKLNEKKDWFVYWLSRTKEDATRIREEIADKTGLFCQIGYLTPKHKKEMTTLVESVSVGAKKGKIREWLQK